MGGVMDHEQNHRRLLTTQAPTRVVKSKNEEEENMKCNEIMTKDPVCCLPVNTVDMVAQLMKDEDVGPIPVVSDYKTKRLLGIVTDRDLALKIVAMGRYFPGIKVEEVMTRNPVTCRDDDDLRKAVQYMEQYRVRRIPVVDKDNRILGIIAQADIATRVNQPQKIAEMVGEISRPAIAAR
jgi:CBS domain-containing protein